MCVCRSAGCDGRGNVRLQRKSQLSAHAGPSLGAVLASCWKDASEQGQSFHTLPGECLGVRTVTSSVSGECAREGAIQRYTHAARICVSALKEKKINV